MNRYPKWVVQVAIDAEVDKSPDWSNTNPAEFKSITEAIPKVLMPLLVKYGVRPTFFLSPETLRDSASMETILSLGDDLELASHLHADVIEPKRRIDQLDGKMIEDFQTDYPTLIEFEKLNNLTKLFFLKTGRRPMSFRAGRWAARAHTIDCLARLGYRADSSVAPLDVRECRGPVVDYSFAPNQPYYPSKKNLAEMGSKGPVMEIPHTVVAGKLVTSLRRTFRGSTFCSVLPIRWLNPAKMRAENMIKTALMVESQNRSSGYINLNISFHSFELLPGKSPYAQTKHQLGRYLGALEGFLRFAVANRTVTFATTAETVDIFEGLT